MKIGKEKGYKTACIQRQTCLRPRNFICTFYKKLVEQFFPIFGQSIDIEIILPFNMYIEAYKKLRTPHLKNRLMHEAGYWCRILTRSTLSAGYT